MATTEPDQPSEPTHEPGERRKRIRRWISVGLVSIFVIVIAMLGIDSVRSAVRMLDGIKDARASLDDGAESVVVGDPEAAIPQFHQAIDRANAAAAASGHPSMKILRLLPVVGPNIRAAAAIAAAEGDAAQAGITFADAAKTLGWNDILVPGAQPLGNVDLAKIQTATPKIDSVARQLDAALVKLQAAGGGHLFGYVSSGYGDVLSALQRRALLAEDMKNVFHLLPGLLGGQGDRHYLVAVQSLGKPKATGGLITVDGVLSAHQGHVSLGKLSPASPDLAATNLSPDLPTDTPAMLDAAKHDGLGSLDGVILTDPVGLQDLLWIAGPVSPADLHGPVTMDSGVDVLEKRLFLGMDAASAAKTQADVSTDIIRNFLGRRPSMEAFAIGMGQAISQHHLAIWTSSTDELKLLDGLGADGSFDTKEGPLAVIWRATANNRAASLVRRTTVEIVKLRSDGLAIVKTKILMVNHAAKGPASLLLGRRRPIGVWSADATLYLPRRVANASAVTTPRSTTKIGEDLDTTTATGSLSAGPGGSSSMIVDYKQRKAADQQGQIWRYQLVIVPRPELEPTTVRISITLPEGMTMISKAGWLTRGGGGVFTYTGMPQVPVTLWISYR